ncbi:MAG: GPW/gp25 family protein [Dehalococcoidia bacterium]
MDDFSSNREWLGRGWGFPPEFDRRSREVNMVSAETDIAQSLEILLSTAPGERVMNPTYGCGLRALVFEIISETTITQIRDAIERAVLFFEPRIKLNNIEVDAAEAFRGLLRIRLNYTIKTTNSRSNIVYPFYFQEGTSVSLP